MAGRSKSLMLVRPVLTSALSLAPLTSIALVSISAEAILPCEMSFRAMFL